MPPVALAALLAGAVAAVGGRFDWATLPILAAAAALLVASKARIGADPSTRALDACVLAALAVLLLQLVPLPPSVLAAISPHAASLQDAIALQPLDWRPASIHPAVTRGAFASALAAAFVFWASQAMLASTQASRLFARLLAGFGLLTAMVAVAQHVSAPTLLYWRWPLADPRAVPYGPFISRNHLATWMVLTICLTAAALAGQVRTRLSDRMASGGRALAVAILDGESTPLVAAIAGMLVALASTLSRSGLVALAAAAAAGAALHRGRRDARAPLAAAAAAAAGLLAIAMWANSEGVADRVEATLADRGAAMSRVTIWRETLPIVRDFPLTGVGGGAFGDAMTQYQRTSTEVLFNHAHNEYLQVLTEGGAPLLVSVLAGLVALVRIARRRLRDHAGERRMLCVGACAGLAGIAVQSVWEVGLRTPANLLLAAAFAGLIASREISKPKVQIPKPNF